MYKKILFSFLLVAILCIPITVLAEETTGLVLQGPQQQMSFSIDEAFTIDLQIQDSLDVYGVEGHLTFDPAILEVVDMDTTIDGVQVQGGTFINPTDEYVFVLQNQADNIQGTIDYALALRNPAPAANGDGLLMSITFRPKAEGETNITIADSLLVSSQVTKIVHSAEPLLVNIANPSAITINEVSMTESISDYFGLISVGVFLLILSFVFALYVLLKKRTTLLAIDE
ncbi:MAG: cohesin domain-containing protein [Candidatus Promineifilaceae bacterium]